MTLWDNLDAKGITLSDKFRTFCTSLRHKFAENVGPGFRLYAFPANFGSITQRRRIDETNYSEIYDTLLDPDKEHPLLYVWNSNEATPEKIPLSGQKKGDGSRSGSWGRGSSGGSSVSNGSRGSSGGSSARKGSRNSSKSAARRKLDNYTCTFCGLAMDCAVDSCHLFTVAAHDKLGEDEQRTKLDELGLQTVNDLENMITLCKVCHRHFDAHKMGIHRDLRLLVSRKIRPDKIHGWPKSFGQLHARTLVFTAPVPPPAVLELRMLNFRNKHGVDHYCHFCSDIFTTLVDLESHLGSAHLDISLDNLHLRDDVSSDKAPLKVCRALLLTS